MRRRASTAASAHMLTHGDEITILKETAHFTDHFLTPEQLESIYRTSAVDGLTESIAEDNLHHYGPNKLIELKGSSYWKIFRHHLFGWFQCVLWVGALLNFGTFIFVHYMGSSASHEKMEYLYLGLVISATVLITGLFGFYQEAKSVAAMSEFENLIPPEAIVIREGITKCIPNSQVTIGDLVILKGGAVVPADVRVVECVNLSTDMSSLTGEPKAVKHTPENTHENPLESKNMCYFGCPIVEGHGKGFVVAVGEMTEIGKIAGLVTGLEKVETPMSKEITLFIKLICIVAFVFGLLFFIMVLAIQNNWISAFMYMLGIILANVPEGLIVTLTVCKTLSAAQLKQKNCLAKTGQAVETLGSTSVICSDKTGTLTENKMSVSNLFCGFKIYSEEDHSDIANPVYAELCVVASLNLKAKFSFSTMDLPVKKRKIIGDASESAILRYMEQYRSAMRVQQENPTVAEIPFSSVYKYQITIHLMQSTKSYYLIMKGAPEVIVEHCNKIFSQEGVVDITPEYKRDIRVSLLKLQQMGERVIGYGSLWLPKSEFPVGFPFNTENTNFPLFGLCFIGAVSLIDPPRENIDKDIDLCRQAGIKVIMVTGDHPVTALSISRKCKTITHPTAYDYAFENHIEVVDVPPHIKKQFKAAVITGDELRKKTPAELAENQTRYDEITFARTSPQQKLMIVESYQNLDYVVAVTGDGVNDSPALKKADIGIAMGITGTEVSKQAADMILLDDNFTSIVLGIREGRKMFDNLKKTIAYTLTSNTPEMLPFVMYACFGIPLPLTLILILVINVGTDLLPAMSLAYEESEEDIMKIPPRKPTDHLVNRHLLYMAYFQVGLIQFFAGIYSYFVVFAKHGFFPSSLFMIRDKWEKSGLNVRDTLGRQWNFVDRKTIERKAQTAYFIAICLTQVSDVIICKTRRISILKKGMTNHVLNASIILELCVAGLVTYLPFCNTVFGTEPIDIQFLFLPLPFFVLMIVLDEIRRYIIRNNLSAWVETETYY